MANRDPKTGTQILHKTKEDEIFFILKYLTHTFYFVWEKL